MDIAALVADERDAQAHALELVKTLHLSNGDIEGILDTVLNFAHDTPFSLEVVDAGNSRVVVTERGTTFGYHNLIVDMRAFPMMRARGVPVVFDVTHSLQLPGGGDGVTAGLAEYIEPLASAGVAAGVDGVFVEVHEDPARAKSDAQNALRLDMLEPLLHRLRAIDAIVKDAEVRLRG